VSAPADPGAELERRLRRLHADLDAGPGFEARLAARVARLEAVPRASQRARADAERRRAEAALRGRLWMALGVALALACAAVALVRLFGAEAARQFLGHVHPSQPVLTAVSCALAAAAAWYAMHQALRGHAPRLHLV